MSLTDTAVKKAKPGEKPYKMADEKGLYLLVNSAGKYWRMDYRYQWTPHSSEPRQIECSLWIERTACNYGGSRPWFLCPSCRRRCAVVYYGAAGGRFACRHCTRVAYLSQCDDEMGRLWRRQWKIERKLAGGAGEWNRRQKPKGMHRRTFDRLRNQVWELEMRRDDVFEVQAASLLRRLGVFV